MKKLFEDKKVHLADEINLFKLIKDRKRQLSCICKKKLEKHIKFPISLMSGAYNWSFDRNIYGFYWKN